ncbi:MAG: hypothetical protein D6785_10955, partial [Planctomycetota bacterium]
FKIGKNELSLGIDFLCRNYSYFHLADTAGLLQLEFSLDCREELCEVAHDILNQYYSNQKEEL